jgi:beta-phosphoglucomutase-like phosphatase (HAD superfamily)
MAPYHARAERECVRPRLLGLAERVGEPAVYVSSTADAASTAAPTHGEDTDNEQQEQQEDGVDEEELLQEATVYGVDDVIEKEETSDSAMAPYLEALYALSGASAS